MTSIIFRRIATLSSRSVVRISPTQHLFSPYQRGFAVFPKGVDLLNDPESLKCAVKRYGPKAFLINNVYLSSSVVLFPNFYLQWRVKKIEDMTIDDLSVFKLLYPGLQILLIGCGQTAWTNRVKKQEFINHFIKFGITLEFLSSRQAASTFTILNSEERKVAAAIVTLEPFTDDEEAELFREYKAHLPTLPSSHNSSPSALPDSSNHPQKEKKEEEVPVTRR